MKRKKKTLLITDEERKELFSRYYGFDWYTLVTDEQWLIVFIELNNQKNINFNGLKGKCNNVIEYINKQHERIHTPISSWKFNAIIQDEDNKKYFTLEREFKIINGKRRVIKTQIIGHKEEYDNIIKLKRIEHSNTYKVTLTKNVQLPRIDQSISVSDTVSCVVNAPVSRELSLRGPNFVIKKVSRPSS